jgi:uncharacterized repeat protein (TIGR03843 family)
VPALQPSAGPRGPHLPPAERLPALTGNAAPAPATGDALTLLTLGRLEVTGRIVDASNATLYGEVSLDGVTAACVYKPVRGERPLWDFPDGTLAGREVSAYLVSAASGWDLVPPTVLRDGPFGPGMCQLWIDTEEIDSLVDVVPRDAVPAGWKSVVDGTGIGGVPVTVAHADDARLRRLAVLDAVLNNADRKGGHLLLESDRLYGVDHGICFHHEDKLRTVLWGWGGDRLPEEAVDTLRRLRADLDGGLGDLLHEHLTRREVAKTARRVDRLLSTGRYPRPGGDWPAVPWPPF